MQSTSSGSLLTVVTIQIGQTRPFSKSTSLAFRFGDQPPVKIAVDGALHHNQYKIKFWQQNGHLRAFGLSSSRKHGLLRYYLSLIRFGIFIDV